MAKPKANTLQAKLGFFDEDLKKPLHDDIMLWVNSNAEKIIHYAFPDIKGKMNNEAMFKKQVDRYNNIISNTIQELNDKKPWGDYWNDYYTSILKKLESSFYTGDIPKSEFRIEDIIWECPVISCNKYHNTKHIIGFVDMQITYSYDVSLYLNAIRDGEISFEHIDNLGIRTNSVYNELFIEVKTKIDSLGELYRQLNMYLEYLPNAEFMVICPDDKFKKPIEDQGFKFLKYDPINTI